MAEKAHYSPHHIEEQRCSYHDPTMTPQNSMPRPKNCQRTWSIFCAVAIFTVAFCLLAMFAYVALTLLRDYYLQHEQLINAKKN